MTTNQLAFWRDAETKRWHVATELETHRANIARETEQNRANLAQEFELNRHNLATEALESSRIQELQRSNRVQESLAYQNYLESVRSHTVNESIAYQNAATAARNADYAYSSLQYNYAQLAEQRRANSVKESQTAQQLSLQEYQNLTNRLSVNDSELARLRSDTTTRRGQDMSYSSSLYGTLASVTGSALTALARLKGGRR